MAQFSSVAQSRPTLYDPWAVAHQASVAHHQLPELAQTPVHPVGDAMQPSHPSSTSSPPAFSLSQHQGRFHCWFFTSCGQRIGASTSASVLPMNTQVLISFRIDWFDVPAVQETLKSLLQHHSSKSSVLWRSAFFMVQLLTPIHYYWKNHSFD